MALVERLAILITGDASGAINEMKKVASEAEKNAAKADGTVSKFSGTATKVGAGMMAAGAGLLAVGVSAANTTTDLGREVMKLQRYTGMNAESASKLAYAAKISGVGVDDLAVGIGKLSKTMANTPDKLGKIGVEAKTSDGHLRKMTDVLSDVADRFHKMGPGTEATAAALDLFGRSGANLLPFLLKGKDGIAELSTEAEKMGLVLSQDNVDAVKANIVAQRHLSAAIDGAKVQIGNEMLPILTKFTELMTGIPGPVRDIVAPVVILGGVVLVTGGAFLLMAGQVQKAKTAYAEMSVAGQTSIGVLGMAAAAATVAVTAYTVMQGAADKAKASQKNLNDQLMTDALAGGLPSVQKALTDTGNKMTATFGGNGDSAAGRVWNFLTRRDPWNAFNEVGKLEGLSDGYDRLSMMTAASVALSDATGKSQDSMLVWLGEMEKGGTVFPTVAAAVAAYTGKIDANKAGTKEAADAQDGYAASIKHANDVLRGTTDPIFAVMSAQDSLTEAKKNYETIQNDGTKTSAEKEQALRKEWQASYDLTSAQTKLGEAIATGSVSGPKLQAALDTLRLNGIDPTTEAGKALSEKILGVDATAATVAALLKGRVLKVETDDSELERSNRLLANRRNDLEWMLAHDPGTKGNGLGIFLPKNASGGFLSQGQASLVGEHGPELFIPSSSGSVVNALSTSHAMAGGDGGSTMTINITMPPGSDGADVVEAIRKYERMNGTGWRN